MKQLMLCYLFFFFLNTLTKIHSFFLPSQFHSSFCNTKQVLVIRSSDRKEGTASSSVEKQDGERLQLDRTKEERKRKQEEGGLLSQILDDIILSEDNMLSVDNSHDHIFDNTEKEYDQSDYEPSWRTQKLKWKSKRYNMLKEVTDLIEAREETAIERASSATNKLIEMNEDGDYKPIVQSFNLWLQAIAKTSTSQKKGEMAEAVLTEMKKHCAPTVISYTIAITAYTDFPQEAERLLFELLERQQTIDPSLVITSSITTDAVLHAWAEQGTEASAERARRILERLEQWKLSAADGLQNNLETTSHTYSIVMNAYSKTGNVQEVEAMLAKRIYEDEKLGEKMVDTVMYNVAIKAWALSKSPRAGSRATALLRQMKETGVKPDIITFNSVLSAWSKSSGHINAAEEAESVLKEMIVTSKETPSSLRPNTVSYNTVLHAWSQSPQPIAVPRASAMLEYMIRSQDPPPDIYSFTSVLNVLAKSKTYSDKALKARMLLDKLLELSQQKKELKPSVIAFNIVLNACAFSASFDEDAKKQALQVAVTTFSQLRSGSVKACAPDDVTYGNMIKAIANLVPKKSQQRGKLGMTIMRQCMEDGLVGEMVWKELPNCVSRKALESLLPQPLIEKFRRGGKSLELVDLPRSWRRNVKTKARRKLPSRKSKTRKEEPSVATTRSVIKGPRGISEASWTGKEL